MKRTTQPSILTYVNKKTVTTNESKENNNNGSKLGNIITLFFVNCCASLKLCFNIAQIL